MKQLFSVACLVSLVPGAFASDLALSVQSGGSNQIDALPGNPVVFDIVGELSDNANLGLAGFAFDVSATGGQLSQLAAPAGAPMENFDTPLGLTNPAGYGGTLVGGTLLQVGGMQNTINNFLGIPPTGGVATGVAGLGAPQVLASGQWVAASTAGTFSICAENLVANVIRDGETGSPFWACDEADTGSIDKLEVDINVRLSSDVSSLSLSSPGVQTLTLEGGFANQSRFYLVLGTVSGTSPGVTIGALQIPLNPDFYTTISLTAPNLPPLTNSLGLLNGIGEATCQFTLPSGLGPSFLGLQVSHAFLMVQPEDFVSNAVSIDLVP